MKRIKRLQYVLLLAITFTGISSGMAQVSLGGGISGLKFLGDGSERPSSIGAQLNLGIDLNEKAGLLITPSYYFPVDYSYVEKLVVNDKSQDVNTTERLNILMASALLRYNLLGTNSGGAAIYMAAGPSIATYDIKVTRENLSDRNLERKFTDFMLDFRLGVDFRFGPVVLFGEGQIAPIIATNLEKKPVYSPHRGTVVAATAGLRFKI